MSAQTVVRWTLVVVFGLAIPGSLRAVQPDVAGVAEELARAWSGADLDRLSSRVSEAGVHLSVEGRDEEGLGRRQVRAALARFLEGFDSAGVSVVRAESLGGDPEKALVELAWRPRAAGTTEVRSFVIFVSLEHSGADWRVTEIRVFS